MDYFQHTAKLAHDSTKVILSIYMPFIHYQYNKGDWKG